MKRAFAFLSLLVLTALACSLSGLPGAGEESAAPTEPPKSEKRCGDGVCDGPENLQNCAADCASGLPPQSGNAQTPENQAQATPGDSPSDENARTTDIGFVIVKLLYEQAAQEGECGKDVWTVENGFPPCYWWGEYYEVAMTQMLTLSKNGSGVWEIQPRENGKGYYQTAKAWDDNQRCCSPTLVEGKDFDFNSQGSYQDGTVSLVFSASPVYYWEFENRPENCPGAQLFCPSMNGSASHSRLLYAWADAMNNNYQDLSSDLYVTGEMGIYRRDYSGASNPIPNDSVSIRVEIEFQCITPDQAMSPSGVYKTIACPWEVEDAE